MAIVSPPFLGISLVKYVFLQCYMQIKIRIQTFGLVGFFLYLGKKLLTLHGVYITRPIGIQGRWLS